MVMDERWPPAGQRHVELGTRAGTLRAFGSLTVFTGLDAVAAVLADDYSEVTLNGEPITADRARQVLADEAQAILAALPRPPMPPRTWQRPTTGEQVTGAGLRRTGHCSGPDGDLRVEYGYHAIWVEEPAMGEPPDGFILTTAQTWLNGVLITDPDRARALAAAAGLAAERQLPGRA
jgi:hypothetical protein